MFKNFLKVALRNLWRGKIFTAINVLGLAIGLATCLLICVYVTDELGYDRYNKHFDDIYRVDADINFGGAQAYLATVPDAMGPVLKKDYPDVLQYTRFLKSGNMLFKRGDQNINESRGALADSTIFDVFSLQMLQGDPAKALTYPNSIVITASKAREYFNSPNVLGKSMILNDSNIYKVTGVIADMPSQSHFNFDYLLALSAQEGSRRNNWFGNDFNT